MKKPLLFLLLASMTMFAIGQNLSGIATRQETNRITNEPGGEARTLLVLDLDVRSSAQFSSMPLFMSNTPKNAVFFENFDGTSGTVFPTGWTTIATPGGNNWSTLPLTHLTAYSGTRYARIMHHTTVAHNAWLFTPGITLTQGTTYRISFWLNIQGHDGVQERLIVNIGRSATVAAMDHLLFDNNSADYPRWTLIHIDYVPEETGEFFVGFHANSPRNGNHIAFDDFSIAEVPQNNLQNITNFQYSQVPVSQIFPVGRVKNMGLAEQTNIVLSVQVNGNQVGTSAPLASLQPNATAELTLVPSVNIPLGQNTVTYTISQTETNTNPEGNVRSFEFRGTHNVFAVDGVTTQTQGMGGTSPLTIGNIFQITQTATLSQIAVGFGNSTALDYTISLYTMTDDVTTSLVPIFTIPATRNAIGFAFIDVPSAHTTLEPGLYYLSVNQISAENISILRDGDINKISYIRAPSGLLRPAGYFGAMAIRMVMEAPTCTNAPANLAVVPDYISANFSWEGEAVRFVLTLNDGINDRTYQTAGNSLTVTGLIQGTSYTWKVTAWCDATQYAETTGTPFSTLFCTPITTIPWQEGFEGNRFPPECWFIYQVEGAGNWTRSTLPAYVHTGQSAAGRDGSAHSAGPQDNYLITPPITIPNDGSIILEFWSRMFSPDTYNGTTVFGEVMVSTTNTDPSSFTAVRRLDRNLGEVTASWQRHRISLNDYSGQTIYIAFRYVSQGRAYHWFIDDVSVREFSFTDIEVVAITAPNSGQNINLTANEQVTVLLRNNGSAPISGFDLKLELNGQEIETEIHTASIRELSRAEYTFSTTLDLSETGTYQIRVTAILNNDEVQNNNVASIAVANQVCTVVVDFPFTEGFENNGLNLPTCWRNERISGTVDWQVVAAGTGRLGAHSGNFKARFISTVYTQPSARLTLPKMNLSEMTNPTLTFWRTTERWQNDQDILHVYYRTSEAGEWVRLATYNDNVNSWQNEIIPLPNVSNEYYVSFVAVSHYGHGIQLDDVQIFDLTDFTDGELVSIIMSGSGELTAEETIAVLAKNNGAPLTTFDLILEIDGDTITTETWTGLWTSGQTISHTFVPKMDFSAPKSYDIKVTLVVEGDEDLSNNVLTKTITNFSSEIVQLFGYRIFDLVAPPPAHFVSFMSNDPTNVNIQDPAYTLEAPANSMVSGEFVNGYFYGFTEFASVNPEVGSHIVHFVKINTRTMTNVFAKPISRYPHDLAFDHTSGVMYGIFAPRASATLVTVDMETGELTELGELGVLMLTLACNSDGELFGICIEGRLYSINKTTAIITEIGFTGLTPEYIQSMAFDHNTGRLFWAMTDRFVGRLIEVNTKNAVVFNRGTVGAQSQIIGLFTKPQYIDVVSVFPANGEIDVPVNTEVHVLFNSMDVVANDLSGITINGNPVAATLHHNKLTLNHGGFSNETWYMVNIPAGAIAEYNQAISWSFTTAEEPTSIEIIAGEHNLTVYPNPVSDLLHIQTDLVIEQISVLDLNGRIILTLQGDNRAINLQSLPTGQYIVKIHTETTIIPVKIVKQ